jgi:hypothetical protein
VAIFAQRVVAVRAIVAVNGDAARGNCAKPRAGLDVSSS